MDTIIPFKIICKNNKKVIFYYIQNYSEIIQNLKQDLNSDTINLENISYQILKQIEIWCKYADLKLNIFEKKKVFQQFIHNFELKLLNKWKKKKKLLKICKAVDFLHIPRLYDILCFFIANMLRI